MKKESTGEVIAAIRKAFLGEKHISEPRRLFCSHSANSVLRGSKAFFQPYLSWSKSHSRTMR